MSTITPSNSLSEHLANGEINFASDTFQVLLMMNGFTFAPTTQDTLTDITEDSWAATTVYAESDIIIPTTPNGHKYQIDTGDNGTTGATVPTFPTTSGGTVVDGTCTWTEIGADDQCPTANGYTQNNKALANVAVSGSGTTGITTISWDDPSWVAAGGYLGSADGSAVLIDGILLVDTTVSGSAIIAYYKFSSAGYTADTKGLQAADLSVEIGGTPA